MTTILSEHSRGISNSLTLSNHFIAMKMTKTYSVSTLRALQLTLTKHFSVFYTSKQETQACIHIYRTRPLWKCTKFPGDSLHCLLNLIKRITLLIYHCMNFGIYKTFTFHVNMPKDPLSSPLLGIYFTFAFKSKGLKGDLFVIFT